MLKGVRRVLFDFFSSPFSFLSLLPVIIISSSRLAYGITAFAALLWVRLIPAFVKSLAGNFFPALFNNILFITLCSVAGGLFLLVLSFLNPVLAKETLFISLLAPVCCFAGESGAGTEKSGLKRTLLKSVPEALTGGFFIIILSALREVSGYGSLSLPGGEYAIYELFNFGRPDYIPRVFSTPAGALFLTGFAFIIFMLIKKRRGHKADIGGGEAV